MFTINPYYQHQSQVPYYDMNSFVDFFDELQRARQKQLAEQSRPKIVKKVEAEEKYQIQIFKEYGDFNSYEVKAVRDARIPGVINIIIQSSRDNFKKVFQFQLGSIELEQIDWEYFESDNVLVLNIPKKIKVCCDSLEFGFPAFLNFDYPYLARQQKLKLREKQYEKHEERAKEARVRKAEKARKAEVKAARKVEERARREAEREAELKAKKEAEEKARREAQEKARKEAIEAQKKKESELKAKREEYEKAEKERREAYHKQQQEFFNQVFGNFFGQFEPQVKPQAVLKSTGEKKNEYISNEKPVAENKSESFDSETHDNNVNSDTESIDSEDEVSTVSTPSSPVSESEIKNVSLNLHRQPSLEEVEDEEFVMFRKKFGK